VAPVLAIDGASRFYVKLLSSPSRVLVLGAGDGVVASALAMRGHEVTAVEPSASLREVIEEKRGNNTLTIVSDDPRTLELKKRFSLVIAPNQSLGLAQSPDEVHAMLSVMAKHLETGGAFALDMLVDAFDSDVRRARPFPHLRERGDAIHPLSPLRLPPAVLDDVLEAVGLEARERYGDFVETPFSATSRLQVVSGGKR
jgi:hypothetical protein